MSETPWIKWFPSDFLNGIAELSPHEAIIYTVILNRIYDEGGPIPDEPEKIGRRCNMRPSSAEKAVAALAKAGKIIRARGLISNARAEKEIKSRQKVREKLTQNALARWEKLAEKPNENNETEMQKHSKSTCKSDALPEARSQKLEENSPNRRRQSPEPVVAVAADKVGDLRARLLKVFGAKNLSDPTLVVRGKWNMLWQWAEAWPADWIVEEVERMWIARKDGLDPPQSLGYFAPMLTKAWAERTAPMAAIRHPSSSSKGHPHGSDRSRRGQPGRQFESTASVFGAIADGLNPFSEGENDPWPDQRGGPIIYLEAAE